MAILSQSQIENETRSKWGGEVNRIQQDLLKRSLTGLEDFIKGVFGIFPQMAPYMAIKAIEADAFKVCGPDRCHHHDDHHHAAERAKEYTPQKISGMERAFRNQFGDGAATQLLDLAERWQLSMFMSEEVGPNGFWGSAYFLVIDATFRQQHLTSNDLWDRLPQTRKGRVAPPIQVIIDPGDDYIQKIYKEGYQRVTSKVTKQHLPKVMEIMTDGMKAGKSWQELAAEMNQLGGAEAWHWTRLVRSEMINASQQAAIEQAMQSEDLHLLWSTSRGKNACKVCLERNGKVFDPAKMGLDEYFATDETRKIDAKREIKVGRFAHPNCRCALVPTYMPVTWGGEAVAPEPKKPIEPAQPAEPDSPWINKNVGKPGTGTGKARITGKHKFTPEELAELQAHADAKLKEYGINDDIEISMFSNRYENGYIELKKNQTFVDKMYLHDRLNPKLTDRRKIFEEIKNTTSHELKHVQQVNSGKMQESLTHTMWEGKPYISHAEFQKVLSAMRSRNPIKAKKAYETYKNFPWEKEAFETASI